MEERTLRSSAAFPGAVWIFQRKDIRPYAGSKFSRGGPPLPSASRLSRTERSFVLAVFSPPQSKGTGATKDVFEPSGNAVSALPREGASHQGEKAKSMFNCKKALHTVWH